MLLHPMVKEKMHLQENELFDLDLVVKVTQNVAQYMIITPGSTKLNFGRKKISAVFLPDKECPINSSVVWELTTEGERL